MSLNREANGFRGGHTFQSSGLELFALLWKVLWYVHIVALVHQVGMVQGVNVLYGVGHQSRKE